MVAPAKRDGANAVTIAAQRSRAVSWGALALGVVACGGVAACGAKTGLDTPDTPEPDAVDVADASDAVDVRDAQPDAICVEPAPDAAVPLLQVDLETRAQLQRADVLFVVDHTGSMQGEIDNIRTTLQTVIVPGLVRAIPDVRLGVVSYGDFPLYPYGEPGSERTFVLEHALTSEFAALQAAISALRAGHGGDDPEAMVEALYQVATGEGELPFIAPSSGCPSVGVGYACFRRDAEPVVVLVSDAPSHNGPGGLQPYDEEDFAPAPTPHTYAEMIAALAGDLRARFIGINSADVPPWGRDDMARIGRDTGTLGSDGMPLVFDIGSDGAGLGDQVVRAIERFAAEVRFDATARALDVDGSGGAELIRAVRPLRAAPSTQVQQVDDTAFYGVLPGTTLTFGLDVDRTLAVPTAVEQRFTVRVQFYADGRPTLGFRDVEFVIPAAGASPCADGGSP